jgi:GNAT superfamily N-acetyltransferase
MQTMYSIRAATPADIPAILDLIRALAAYEREPDAVKTTEADLLRDGFGEQPCFECLIAENGDELGQAAGFALYFYNYSTWRGRSGIHLEDLFVLPRFRGQGIGKALLARVAARAAERGCLRLQWDVLAWNQTAIDFYQSLGAQFLDEWRIMRVADEGIRSLAALATASGPAR